MAVTKSDLEDQIGTNAPRPILYCEICGAENSACIGDYFMLADDHVFECCDTPMALIRIQRTITVIKE